ncbi:MAG: transposase [Patescibacteria group bacterium]|nr:transposase [Patescibacteria group bacterium]
MTSLADIPNEARCKRIIQTLKTGKDCCPRCGARLVFKHSVTYGWCKHCCFKVRPKAITWFRNSKLSYRTIFKLITCWQTRQSPGAVRAITGLSYTTIARWYAKFRNHIPPDGGELLSGVVAVDEAWFGKKRYGKQTIVMGAIEIDTRKLRLKIIPDTEQDSIELFLEAWVTRDSHLITDCSSSYNGVEWLGYSRDAYNHSIGHFGQSNHIECIWSAMKRHLRKLYGCIPTKYLQAFLNEWMARHNQPSLFKSPQNYLKATLVPC